MKLRGELRFFCRQRSEARQANAVPVKIRRAVVGPTLKRNKSRDGIRGILLAAEDRDIEHVEQSMAGLVEHGVDELPDHGIFPPEAGEHIGFCDPPLHMDDEFVAVRDPTVARLIERVDQPLHPDSET